MGGVSDVGEGLYILNNPADVMARITIKTTEPAIPSITIFFRNGL